MFPPQRNDKKEISEAKRLDPVTRGSERMRKYKREKQKREMQRCAKDEDEEEVASSEPEPEPEKIADIQRRILQEGYLPQICCSLNVAIPSQRLSFGSRTLDVSPSRLLRSSSPEETPLHNGANHSNKRHRKGRRRTRKRGHFDAFSFQSESLPPSSSSASDYEEETEPSQPTQSALDEMPSQLEDLWGGGGGGGDSQNFFSLADPLSTSTSSTHQQQQQQATNHNRMLGGSRIGSQLTSLLLLEEQQKQQQESKTLGEDEDEDGVQAALLNMEELLMGESDNNGDGSASSTFSNDWNKGPLAYQLSQTDYLGELLDDEQEQEKSC